MSDLSFRFRFAFYGLVFGLSGRSPSLRFLFRDFRNLKRANDERAISRLALVILASPARLRANLNATPVRALPEFENLVNHNQNNLAYSLSGKLALTQFGSLTNAHRPKCIINKASAFHNVTLTSGYKAAARIW